jgi:hypothetical protein
MDENEIERMADDFFVPFEEFADDMTLDDALSLAEAMELRFSYYISGIRDSLQRLR